jgi:hypothetical protein
MPALGVLVRLVVVVAADRFEGFGRLQRLRAAISGVAVASGVMASRTGTACQDAGCWSGHPPGRSGGVLLCERSSTSWRREHSRCLDVG